MKAFPRLRALRRSKASETFSSAVSRAAAPLICHISANPMPTLSTLSVTCGGTCCPSMESPKTPAGGRLTLRSSGSWNGRSTRFRGLPRERVARPGPLAVSLSPGGRTYHPPLHLAQPADPGLFAQLRLRRPPRRRSVAARPIVKGPLARLSVRPRRGTRNRPSAALRPPERRFRHGKTHSRSSAV